MDKKKLIIAVIAVVVVGVVVYYCCIKPKAPEKFLAAGSMQHLGAIIPDGVVGDYELISGGNNPPYPSLDSSLAASDFAELVNSGDEVDRVTETINENRPLERLQSLSDSYFPTIASKALPFSQAAAKPLYHSHSVNLPRVNLKGKLYEMNLAEAVRGSVAISYDPNVALIAASQYRSEDSFNPGLMTGAYNSLYNKLTGNMANLPMYFSNTGGASGHGGMPVEVIMDT
jgi:hypothetical protein